MAGYCVRSHALPARSGRHTPCETTTFPRVRRDHAERPPGPHASSRSRGDRSRPHGLVARADSDAPRRRCRAARASAEALPAEQRHGDLRLLRDRHALVRRAPVVAPAVDLCVDRSVLSASKGALRRDVEPGRLRLVLHAPAVRYLGLLAHVGAGAAPGGIGRRVRVARCGCARDPPLDLERALRRGVPVRHARSSGRGSRAARAVSRAGPGQRHRDAAVRARRPSGRRGRECARAPVARHIVRVVFRAAARPARARRDRRDLRTRARAPRVLQCFASPAVQGGRPLPDCVRHGRLAARLPCGAVMRICFRCCSGS